MDKRKPTKNTGDSTYVLAGYNAIKDEINHSRFQAVMRISGYIRVFLEKEDGLSYENRYLKWMSKVSASRKLIGFSFRETILYLYFGLGPFVYWSVHFKRCCTKS